MSRVISQGLSQGLSRGLSRKVIYLLYFIIFYTSIVKVYTYVYSPQRPRLKPWERPRKGPCVVQDSWLFMVLFWEMSRVIETFQLSYKHSNCYLTLDILDLCLVLFGVFMIVYGLFWEISRVITNIPIIIQTFQLLVDSRYIGFMSCIVWRFHDCLWSFLGKCRESFPRSLPRS